MASRYAQYRAALEELTRRALADLGDAWGSVPIPPESLLYEVIQELVGDYGLAASTVAADFYDDLRDDLGVGGRFTAIVPEIKDPGAVALVGWARKVSTTVDTVRPLIEGGLQRRIVNASRDVITTSSIQDPSAQGWMRIGSGECDFCAMLIGRGAVYSEESVHFKSHDHCHCGAAPAFDPTQIHEITREFVPSARHRSETFTDYNRRSVRAYLKENADAG